MLQKKVRIKYEILISLFLFCLTFTSCTTNYYLVVSSEETPLYYEDNLTDAIATIPANSNFIYWGKGSVKSNRRVKAKYNSYMGYSPYLASWRRLMKLSGEELRSLTFNERSGYSFNQFTPSVSGSTTSYSTPSSGGSVHVKGYTRKNGTYVRPHTRSAPRRR